MTSLNIKSYLRTLGKSDEYVDVLTRANQLTRIQCAITESNAIPASLMRYCKLGSFSQGSLVLLAENASVATRLKHIAPSILSKIQQSGRPVTQLKIKLQKPDYANHATAHPSSADAARSGASKKRLSQSGIDNLNQLADALPDSDLKRSIYSLLKHGEKKE